MQFQTLQNGLDNRLVFHQPGSQRILFVNIADISNIQRADNIVEEITLFSNKKFHMFNDVDNIVYKVIPSKTVNGTLYTVEVSFVVPVHTSTKNALFSAMRDSELAAIIHDRNNRFWLVGIEQPLKVVTQENVIDNDNNTYTIKLTTQQRKDVLEMSQSWVSTIDTLPLSTAVDTIDGANVAIEINTPEPTGSTVYQPPILPVIVTAPPTGYTIGLNVDIVFAAAGTTIKLPGNAVSGKQYTIKDYFGTSANLPITLSGNGLLIDGGATLSINTNYGSVTVMSINGTWLSTGFVN